MHTHTRHLYQFRLKQRQKERLHFSKYNKLSQNKREWSLLFWRGRKTQKKFEKQKNEEEQANGISTKGHWQWMGNQLGRANQRTLRKNVRRSHLEGMQRLQYQFIQESLFAGKNSRGIKRSWAFMSITDHSIVSKNAFNSDRGWYRATRRVSEVASGRATAAEYTKH